MNPERLQEWRANVRGEGGFNGQAQALLKLMRVSDAKHLQRLSCAFPEAVYAFREERGEDLWGDGVIRVTFVSSTHRTAPREYATGDLAEALTEDFCRSMRAFPEFEPGEPRSNRGPDTWVFAYVVERDTHHLTDEQVQDALREILSMEAARARS